MLELVKIKTWHGWTEWLENQSGFLPTWELFDPKWIRPQSRRRRLYIKYKARVDDCCETFIRYKKWLPATIEESFGIWARLFNARDLTLSLAISQDSTFCIIPPPDLNVVSVDDVLRFLLIDFWNANFPLYLKLHIGIA